jgi:hypothetical protein
MIILDRSKEPFQLVQPTSSSGSSSSGVEIAPEGKGIVGAIFSHTDRQNIYSTGEWTSSGPWTTYTNYQAHADNNAIQFMNMALGDGRASSGTSQNFFGNDSEGAISRQLIFANGNRLGYARDQFHYDNATGYAGHSFQIMPVRNTTSSPISVPFYAYTSDYWEQGYEGCALFVFAPNSSKYSTVSSVSGTSLASTQTNARQTSLTGSYTIPGNTTVLVCVTSTDFYQTTYRFKDTNYFYNLNTTFSNPGIICDMKMLSSLYTSRFNLSSSGSLSSGLVPIWTITATNFGDR